MSRVSTVREKQIVALVICASHLAGCGYSPPPKAPSDIQDPRDPFASTASAAATPRSVSPTAQISSTTRPATSPLNSAIATIFSGRTLGIAAGILGLAGAGVGTVYKVRAKGLADDAKEFCDVAMNRCDGRGMTLLEDARNANQIGNAAFVVWGAGLTTGALLYYYSDVRARQTGSVAPHLGLGLSSIQVGGVW